MRRLNQGMTERLDLFLVISCQRCTYQHNDVYSFTYPQLAKMSH